MGKQWGAMLRAPQVHHSGQFTTKACAITVAIHFVMVGVLLLWILPLSSMPSWLELGIGYFWVVLSKKSLATMNDPLLLVAIWNFIKSVVDWKNEANWYQLCSARLGLDFSCNCWVSIATGVQFVERWQGCGRMRNWRKTFWHLQLNLQIMTFQSLAMRSVGHACLPCIICWSRLLSTLWCIHYTESECNSIY